MKKLIIPLLLFTAVFLTGFFFLRYTYVWAGNMSLFLATPDYFKQIFSNSFPIYRLVSNFLLQFFGMHPVGPAIVALVVTLGYCLLAWLFGKLLPRIGRKWWFRAALGLIIAGSVATTAIVPAARAKELTCEVKICTKNHDWKRILEILPPEVCEFRMDLLPFAILALQETGGLTRYMGHYPLRKSEDMNYHGGEIQTGSFFDCILAECLGIPNEALHHIFQFSCGCPLGSSFLSLQLLIRNNMALGNYTLARKYCAILGRSPRFAAEAKWLAGLCDKEDTLPDGTDSAHAPVVAKEHTVSLAIMSRNGIGGKKCQERFLATQVLDGNPTLFGMMLVEPGSESNVR